MLNFQDEEQRGRIANLSLVAGAGTIAGLAAGKLAYDSPVVNAVVDPLMVRYNQFSTPQPTVFYEGERVRGEVNGIGGVHWAVDGDFVSHGSSVPLGEIKQLNRAWDSYEQSPAGKKLFLAAVEQGDGLGATRQKLYARRGFVESPNYPGVIQKDNRPFAQQLGGAYQKLDYLDFARRTVPPAYNQMLHPLKAGLGLGVGTMAALAGGYMANNIVEDLNAAR